jgi:hypothetical protein
MLNDFKRILVIIVLFSLVLVLGWDSSQARGNQPAALVRIDISSDRELERFAELGIPVFAQLWDEEGETYLLAQVNENDRVQLNRTGFQVRMLDTDSSGAEYYLVSTTHQDIQFQTLGQVEVLDKTDRHLLVRANPSDAEDLLNFGVEIQRLTPHPLALPSSEAALEMLTAITPDPAIQSMINQVDPNTAYDYVGGLSGEWQVIVNGNLYTFLTRYSFAEIPIKKATKYVYDHFVALDLTSYYDHFTDLGPELRSVIAEQPGLTDPDCIVLLIGHLDNRSVNYEVSLNLAPGADDNASGSAGVLIAADILHQYTFACTIRYILFTGEEQGMYGSQAYALDVYNNGDGVAAVVNLDMIGYNSDQYEVIGLHTRPGNAGDLAIANTFAGVVQAYGINLTAEVVQDNERFSDHSSFWNYGYPAILGIEDFDDFTPDYHETTDTISTLDFTYLADFIRAGVGTVAHLAGYIPPEQIFFPLLIK